MTTFETESGEIIQLSLNHVVCINGNIITTSVNNLQIQVSEKDIERVIREFKSFNGE